MDVIAIGVVIGLFVLFLGLMFGSAISPGIVVGPAWPKKTAEARVLRDLLDAVEEVDCKSMKLATRLLENPDVPLEEKESVKTYLAELEQSLETIAANREALERIVSPNRVVGRIPDFEGLRDSLQAQSVEAISSQGVLLKLHIDHERTMTPEKRLNEYALTRLEAIRAAIGTLDTAKIEAGDITQTTTVECIRALVVETVSIDGHISAGEVAFMNRLFGLDFSSEAYIALSPGTAAEGRAARNMVELIAQLAHRNPPAAGLLAREVDNVLLSAIAADGTADEQEFLRANAYKDLLRERLGFESESGRGGRPQSPTRTNL